MTYIRLKYKDHFDKDFYPLLFNKGVYKMYHIRKPKQVYIGSSVREYKKKRHRNGVYGRFKEHVSLLHQGRHHSIYLQNVVNKYGIAGLKVEILYTNDCNEKVLKKEAELIVKYNAVMNGYNTCHTPTSPSMTNERREASSKRMKENNPMKNPETVKKVQQKVSKNYSCIQPILQFSTEGTFIDRYCTLFEAEHKVGVHYTNISRAANNKTKTSGGYIWIYEDRFDEKTLEDKISAHINRNPIPLEGAKKISKHHQKPVIQIDKKYNICKTYPSVDSAIYATGHYNISRACRNAQKTCAGYKWRYLKEFPHIYERQCGKNKCG